MSLTRKIKRLLKRNQEAATKKHRRKALLEPLEPRLLLDGTGFDDPNPVLVIPGFGATMSAAETEAGLDEWFTTRGIAPDKIQADPLMNTYEDLVRTLENIGYEQGENLFVANWDWRVPVAPDDGTPDGVISGVTGQSISDAQDDLEFETGLDYLGYWLKQVQDAWTDLHDEPLDSVDVIAHSTGGLVARSYIQSEAYGGQYDSNGNGYIDSEDLALPVIDDLVLVGVPNQGAGEIWNILQNDFNDSVAKRALAIIVDHAWDLVQEGTPIQGPDYNISEANDPQAFISQYIASGQDLLPTFDFLDSNFDDTFEPEPLSGDDANHLVLDLNFGLDENSGIDPNAFIDRLGGALTVVFGTADETITAVQQRTGPFVSLLPAVQNFNELLGHDPAEGETWYQEVKTLAGGDSTVTRVSAVGQFEGDERLGDTLFLREMSAGHRALVSDTDSQKAVLGGLDLAYGVDYTDTDISVTPQSETTAALMNFFNDPGDTLQELSAGIGEFFDSLQTGFNVIFERLPIIGPAFIEGAQFFSDFADQISSSLISLIDPGPGNFIEKIQNTIFDVFDGYVLDNNADALVNSDDVVIGVIDDALEFGIHLGGEIAGTEVGLGFDVGLDALGLELAMTGGLDLSVQWDLDLGFGVVLDSSLDPDFFLDTSDGNEAELLVYAALTEGTMLSGSLGFLELTASDIVDEDDIDVAGDPGDVPNPQGRTGVFGSVGIDLRDPGYYNPLGSNPTGRLYLEQLREWDLRKLVAGTVNAGADVNLHIVTAFDEGAVFPSISADLDIDWDFLSVDTSQDLEVGMFSGESPAIAFNDVTLDLGSLITDFVGPILDQVEQVLDPVMPFIDMLTTELPVITELADMVGSFGLEVDPGADREPGVSIYDLAATVPDARLAFVLTVLDFVRILDDFSSASDADGVSIDLGSFQLTGTDDDGIVQDIRTGNLADFAPLDVEDFDVEGQLDAPGQGSGAKSFLKNAISNSLQFPILTDPFQAFKLLMGQDADLFYFDLPELAFDFGFGTSFPVFPPFLNIGFDGNFTAEADIDFGFDTYGIRQFKESGDFADIFNGFYLDDHVSGGVDLPELAFSAALEAKAGVDAVLFEAGVRGGIFGEVEFDLHDIDPDGDFTEYEADGKVRVDEMIQRFSIAPTAIFDIDGAVTYGLETYLWVGIKIPLIFKTIKLTVFQDSLDVASGTLVDFNVTYPDETPDLAHIGPDGNLILHTGPNANLRGSAPLNVDGNDIFTVGFEAADSTNPGDYDKIVVSAMGGVEKFRASDIDLIYAEGGAGDDRITIQNNVFVPVEIHGGSGDDRLKAGGGNAVLYGDDGNDELYGGAGTDRLYGGAGNDTIRGGAGDDELFGGTGHDRLRGDAGNDTLIAGSGLDEYGNVVGDDGNIGLDFNDPNRPAPFDDQLDGGTGDDTLYGGAGNDMLLGQSGIDYLYGGTDDDTLRGGTENDFLYGGAGEDLLEGGRGDDAVDGGDGSDTIIWSAGDGADTIGGGNSGAEDILHMTGTAGIDTVEINLGDSSTDIVFNGLTLNVAGIEELGLDVGEGADNVSIHDFGTSINITRFALDLGAADGQTDDNSADTLTLYGTPGDDTYHLYTEGTDLVVAKPEGPALRVASGDAAIGDTFILKAEAGNDIIDAGGQLDPQGRGGVRQELILLRLEGNEGDDIITTRYDNVAVFGGLGLDSLRVRDDEFRTDLVRNLALVATAPDVGYLTVKREGEPDNIVGFEGIEDFRLDLSFDNDLRVLNTINGSTAITGGTGTDQLTVAGAQGPLTVDGSGGILALTIDRIADTNGLSGNLTADTISGLGFVAPITYTGIDTLTLDLGAGADDLTIDGTGAGTTIVNARGGGDEITVKAVDGRTFVHGGMPGDPFGSGFQDTLTVEIGDTSTLTPDSYIDLNYTVDILRVKHLTAELADWLVWDKHVWLDPDTDAPGDEIRILTVEPEWIADHAVIEGNGIDTLAVSDEALEPQAVAIEGERVRIQHGVDLFLDESGGFISDPDQAFSTVVSPDGKNVYTLNIGAGVLGIYSRDDVTGNLHLVSQLSHAWLEESAQVVTSPLDDPSAFGCAVAVSGDRLVVGASNRNTAYIYEKTITGMWTQTFEIDRSHYSGESFGASVAVDGGTVVVGAPNHQYGTYRPGAVFVYEWNGTSWIETELEGGALGADGFGSSVAIEGNTIIVGSPIDNVFGGEDGSAYIFEKTNGQWSMTGKITASQPAPSGRFGSSVALDGDTIIVGAMPPWVGPGSAYVFEKENGQWPGTETVKLTDLVGSEPFGFGYSVSISGDTAIVGAPSYDPGSGSAYIFKRVDESWTYLTSLSGTSTEYNFGRAVAVDGGTAVVTHLRPVQGGYDYDGSVSVYEESGGVWSRAATLTGVEGGDFYESVAVSGNRIFAGAPDRSYPGKEADMVFIYQSEPLIPGARSLGISPDGENLYVARPEADTITVLSRDAATGSLSFAQEIQDSSNLAGVSEITISPDGTVAYAATDAGVAVLERDPLLGALTFSQMIGSTEIAQGEAGIQTGLYYYDPDYTVIPFFPSYDSVSSNVSGAGYYFSGAPNLIYQDLMLNWVTFDLGGYQLHDQPGGDFNVYEENTPGEPSDDEFSDLAVFVSENGVDFYNVTATEGAALNIPGQGDPSLFFARSYDMSGTGLSSVRYITLRGKDVEWYEVNGGFDLDAIGAFVAPALGYSYTEGQDVWKDVGGRPGVYDEGIDTKIFDGNNGYQVSDGAAGLQTGLYYFDQDSSGSYTTGDIVWNEVGGTQGAYDAGIDATIYQTAFGVGRPESTAVSPDGRFVYIASADKITVCRRDDAGDYSRVGTATIANPSMLALSPDGQTLYAARKADSAIDVLAVAEDGSLTLLQTVENYRNGVRGLDGVASLVVTEAYVVAAGETGDALVAFSRDDAGRLTFAQRLSNLYGGVQGLENPNSLALSPDGAYLYVGSSGEALSAGGVAWFGVNLSTPPPAPPLDVVFSGVTSLTLETGDGDDMVSVRDVIVPLTLNTNAGTDTVVVQSVLENISIDLGEDADALDLRDTGSGAVTSILGGAGDDIIRVWRTEASSETTIEAGDGSDTIREAGDGLFGEVTIYGDSQTGTSPGDLLEFDSGGLTAHVYDGVGNLVPLEEPSLPNGQIQTDGFQKAYYFDLEGVSLLETLPIADAGGPYSLPEGGTLGLNGSNSQIPGSTTVLGVEWDINGDGEFGDVAGFNPVLNWADLQDFGIDDDGTYPVALRVTTDVGIDIATADISIGNVAPALALSGGAAYEGRPYTLNLSSSDPGEDTISGWTINWGDDSGDETIRGNPSSVTHLYAIPGNYVITGSATDEDGTYAAGNTLGIEVVAVAPPRIVGSTSTSEGSPYTLELDPGEHIIDRWFVDWGDGTAKQTVEGTTGQLTHTFLNDGNRTIAATAINQYGRVFDLSMALSVENVAPSANAGGPYSIAEGSDLTLSGSGSDPGAADSSLLTFSWDLNGDGTFGDATGPSPTLNWTALKALGMGDDGAYTATLRVSDDDTWTDATANLIITNVAPTAALSGPAEITEGSDFVLVIGNPADPGDDRVTQYMVNWGDGITESVAAPLPDANGFLGSSEISHVYADGDADYTISVQLVDGDDTWENPKTLNLHVKNAVPAVAADNHEVTVNEGQTAANAGTFFDAGGDDVTLTASLGTVTQDNSTGAWSWSFDTSDGPDNNQRVTITATDSDGAATSTAFDLMVKNTAPGISAGSAAVTVIEGQTATNTGTFSDAGADNVILTASTGMVTSNSDGTWSWSFVTGDGPDENRTVTIIATDEDGASATTMFDLSITNLPPEILTLNSPVIDEAGVAVLSGTFSDAGSLDTHTAIVNWGDGTASAAIVDEATRSFTAEHLYADDGPTGTPWDVYPVIVTLADDDLGTAVAQTTVTVNNVAPTVDAGADRTANEGDQVNFAGSFADIGIADTHTIAWDFGDGSTASDVLAPQHVYADNGAYTVTLTVTDDDGGVASDTLMVTVNNVAPALTINGAGETAEGSTYTLSLASSDPGTDVITGWQIAWGDGTIQAVTGNPSSVTHVYAEGPGNYAISAAATDEDGTYDANSILVAVNNVAPQFEAGPDETLVPSVAGVFNRPIVFTDPGLDTWSGTVNFGDATGDQFLAISQESKSFDLSHTYTVEGTYNVIVTVLDDDGGTYTDSFQVEVLLNTPPVAEAGGPYTIDEGSTVILDAQLSSDEQQHTSTLDFKWDLDNDGEYDDATGVTTTYTWADNGSYTVGLKVTDSYGEFSTDTATVTVLNVAPAVNAGADQTVNEGDLVSLNGTFTDPGSADTHTYLWQVAADNGQIIAGGTEQGFSFTPNDNGIYTATFKVTDDDGGATFDTLTVTVANVAPVITSLVSSAPNIGDAAEQQPVTITGTFADAGTLDTHVAVIDWGDGTTSEAIITELNGSGSISGSHQYAAGGIYEITVNLWDDDTGFAIASTAATITGAGVKDGVLYVIGNLGDDHLRINQDSEGFKVHADFLPDDGHIRTFGMEGIQRIEVLLGDGSDHATIAGSVAIPVLIDGGAGEDRLKAGLSPAVLLGGAGNDVLIGGSGPGTLDGGEGDDLLLGCSGDDTLLGGAGNDVLIGGSGDDSLDGGADNDILVGGSGNDTLLGGDGEDVTVGGSGSDIIAGGAGNDTLSGGSGEDNLDGGEGNDILSGGSGDDTLEGGSGDDIMLGDSGDDILTGGDGDDLLIGGPGTDTLSDGSGTNILIDKSPSWVRRFVTDLATDGLGPNGDIRIEIPAALNPELPGRLSEPEIWGNRKPGVGRRS